MHLDGRTNALLQAIASALGAVLIAHAFVRRTVVSYLAYIANLPLSCVFCSSASPRAVPGVFDVTTARKCGPSRLEAICLSFGLLLERFCGLATVVL